MPQKTAEPGTCISHKDLRRIATLNGKNPSRLPTTAPVIGLIPLSSPIATTVKKVATRIVTLDAESVESIRKVYAVVCTENDKNTRRTNRPAEIGINIRSQIRR